MTDTNVVSFSEAVAEAAIQEASSPILEIGRLVDQTRAEIADIEQRLAGFNGYLSRFCAELESQKRYETDKCRDQIAKHQDQIARLGIQIDKIGSDTDKRRSEVKAKVDAETGNLGKILAAKRASLAALL